MRVIKGRMNAHEPLTRLTSICSLIICTRGKMKGSLCQKTAIFYHFQAQSSCCCKQHLGPRVNSLWRNWYKKSDMVSRLCTRFACSNITLYLCVSIFYLPYWYKITDWDISSYNIYLTCCSLVPKPTNISKNYHLACYR